MQLLLTSSSFSHKVIQDFFAKLVKEKGYKTCVIVTTANPKKEKSLLAEQTMRQIKEFGCTHVRFLDIEGKKDIKIDEDIIYVCGGNTFALIKAARESNFKAAVLDVLNNNGLYFGSSAGSVILSPDVSTSLEISPDKNRVGITDFEGLNLVDFHFVPHYRDSMREDVMGFTERHKEKVECVADGQAIYIDAKHRQYIK